MRQRVHGYDGRRISQHDVEAPETTVRVVLSRLKRRGLVENQSGLWRITKKGTMYLSNKLFHQPRHISRQMNKKPKNMIVAFDIPERYRKERDWLRIELRNLGFEMLQRSVWFGPTPFPEDLIHRFKELRILSFIKFFKSEAWDIV